MILGAVLVGGASSRFGSDKAAAMWEGMTLADRTAAAIAPFVDAVVRTGGAEGVVDLPSRGLGPLGGVAGALDHARRAGFASVLTIACDMPRLPDGLVAALLARAPAYCADAPVLGHWPVEALDDLMARLSANDGSDHPGEGRGPVATGPTLGPGLRRGGRDGAAVAAKSRTLSVRRWALSIGAVIIPSPIPLANINTLADLAAL